MSVKTKVLLFWRHPPGWPGRAQEATELRLPVSNSPPTNSWRSLQQVTSTFLGIKWESHFLPQEIAVRLKQMMDTLCLVNAERKCALFCDGRHIGVQSSTEFSIYQVLLCFNQATSSSLPHFAFEQSITGWAERISFMGHRANGSGHSRWFLRGQRQGLTPKPTFIPLPSWQPLLGWFWKSNLKIFFKRGNNVNNHLIFIKRWSSFFKLIFASTRLGI